MAEHCVLLLLDGGSRRSLVGSTARQGCDPGIRAPKGPALAASTLAALPGKPGVVCCGSMVEDVAGDAFPRHDGRHVHLQRVARE